MLDNVGDEVVDILSEELLNWLLVNNVWVIVNVGDETDEVCILFEGDSDLLVVPDDWVIDDVGDGTDNVEDILLEGDSDLLVVTGGWVIDDVAIVTDPLSIRLEIDSDILVVTDGWIIDDVGIGKDPSISTCIRLEVESDLLVVTDDRLIEGVVGSTDPSVEMRLEEDSDLLVVIDLSEEGFLSFVDVFAFVHTEGEKFGSDVSCVIEEPGINLLSVVKRTGIEEDILSEVFDFLDVTVISIFSVVYLIEESVVGVGISIEEKFFPDVISLSGKFSLKSEKYKRKYIQVKL